MPSLLGQSKRVIEDEEEEEGSDEESFAWISAVKTDDAGSSDNEIIDIGEDLGMNELRLEPLESLPEADANEEIPDLDDFNDDDNLLVDDPVLKVVPFILIFIIVRV